MSDPLLSLEKVHAGYRDTKVLQGVSLSVDEGEIVSLLGRNGVGKTTTLRTILGRVLPTSGRIHFDGRDITHLAPADTVQAGIGLVPEERRIFPELTVEENLRVGTYGGADDVEGYTTDEIFDTFGQLEERRHAHGATLSGGEQQMLAIARSLVSGVTLLMLDEPTEGLAPNIVAQVGDVIRDLHDRGITILLVEQNVDAALDLATRHYFLDTGRIVYEGTTEDIESNEAILERHLGVTGSS